MRNGVDRQRERVSIRLRANDVVCLRTGHVDRSWAALCVDANLCHGHRAHLLRLLSAAGEAD